MAVDKFSSSGMSEGSIPNFSSLSQRSTVDKTAATAVSGLGDVLGAAIKATDTAITNQIDTDVRNVQTAEMDLFTQTAPSLGQGAETPEGITKARDSVSRLKEAYDQGKISDTAYYSRLVTATKDLKLKYAGYEDVVDQTVQSVTGIRPANALRKELLATLQNQDAEKAAQDKQWQSQLSNADLQPHLLAIAPDVYTNPAKYNNPNIRQEVIYKAMESLAYDRTLERRIKVTGLTQADREKNASELVFNKGNTELAAIFNSFGANGQDPAKVFEDIASGRTSLTPEQVQQQALILKTKYDQLLSAETQRLVKDSNLPLERAQKIAEQGLSQFRLSVEALQEGKIDVAGMSGRIADAAIKNRSMQLLTQDDFQNMAALQKIAPAFAERYIQSNPLKIDKLLSNVSAANMYVKGEPLSGTATKILNNTSIPQADKTRALKELFDADTQILSDPRTDQETFNKRAKNLFGDANAFNFLDPKSQEAMFGKYVSPQFVKRIVDSGDETLKNSFAQWLTGTAASVKGIKQAASTSSALENVRGFLDYTISPEGTINVTTNTALYEQWQAKAGFVEKMAMSTTLKEAQRSVESLNAVLRPTSMALKALGQDPAQVTPALLQKLNVDLSARSESWLNYFATMPGSTKISGEQKNLSSTIEGLTAAQSEAVSSRRNELRGQGYTSSQAERIISKEFPGLNTGASLEAIPEERRSQVRGLLDQIGKAEGAGYRTIYGNQETKYKANLTEMTLGEVKKLQRQMVADGNPSSAVGKYQFIQKTLASAANALGIDDNQPFTSEVQDQLALYLMNQRGLDKYLSNQMSKEDFQNSLAKEWASVPTTGGRSNYEGIAGNKATKAGFDLVAML